MGSIPGNVWAGYGSGLAGALAGALSAWWSTGFACGYGVRLAARFGTDSPTPGFLRLPACARYGAAAVLALLTSVLQSRVGLDAEFWAVGIALNMLLILAVIDVQLGLLPDALTLPLLWLGLAVAWMGSAVSLHDSVAGAVAGYGFLWLLFRAFSWMGRGEGMGYGDFKLLAALGAWVGVVSLPYVLLAACIAGVSWAFCRQKSFGLAASYPFGPFLAASGAAALILRPDVHSCFW
ncbi:A24 family peptidase [Paralcaligenes sp. KSB-10]|uniref:prepilin peptidase n=1 Tax=Paralcaligenes sp. KSB-10 TaxID=2901142 RepID=UPI001E42573A|nr:A24 family peptidase [Paralcaligenes sp. KSB-10]UHL63985.1 A24 family peptidase [Paralcaligenes sp. KSB-10]